jgi:DNA modification methylase
VVRRASRLPEPVRDQSGVRIYCVDVMEGLRALPDESVQCCVTSPPYWGLRDYGVEGQVGLEKTPEEYVERMVGIFRELRRVLRRDGTFWLNVGDSYAASGVSGLADGLGTGTHWRGKKTIPQGLKPKDLVGVPWRLAFALQADGWYLRSDIIWAKANPMPESVTDRPTKAHEYVFLLTKDKRYFFDQEAVREPAKPWNAGKMAAPKCGDARKTEGARDQNKKTYDEIKGANIRTVWTIPTQPFPEAHFATFPEALPARCIKAGTSERGCCPECGAPWERVVELERSGKQLSYKGQTKNAQFYIDSTNQLGPDVTRTIHTVGWQPTCSCAGSPEQTAWDVQMGLLDADPVPCTVLDPFCGSGTTLFVAKILGRKAIGFDLSEEYCRIADARCSKLKRGGVLKRRKKLRPRRRVRRKGGV